MRESDCVYSKPVGHYIDDRGFNLKYKINVYAARRHTLDDSIPEHLRRPTQVLQMYMGELTWINLSNSQKETLALYD
jgi:hypothetical protein